MLHMQERQELRNQASFSELRHTMDRVRTGTPFKFFTEPPWTGKNVSTIQSRKISCGDPLTCDLTAHFAVMGEKCRFPVDPWFKHPGVMIVAITVYRQLI